jgi:uncharacterized tellurite resistance protein B-like protein
MFERLRGLFQSLGHEAQPQANLTRDDPRVAAAALFFHVIDADGAYSDTEKRKLRELVSMAYDLDGRQLDDVLRAAEKADDEAVDLYAFTSVLKRAMPMENRVGFVGLLWELVMSDGVRHELEENVVWRISELLGCVPIKLGA